MRFTAATLATLKLTNGQKDRIWFDDDIPGFGYRAREAGSASYIYQYKIARKTRRIVLGRATALSPGQARAIASRLHAEVKLGGDPAAEKRAKIERSRHTFGALVDRYVERRRTGTRPRTLAEIERYLDRTAKPLHGHPVDSVDLKTAADLLARVEQDSGPAASNRLRAAMSAMFTWAMKEGLALSNPIANTNKRPERARDRVLSDSELQIIWQALGATQFDDIVRLLLLCAQRREEVGGLRWSEVDFDRGVISLPPERTKNARPHEIPMSAGVRAILAARPRTDRPFVFGRSDGPFSAWATSKRVLDQRIGVAHWTLHDLRRTAATGMGDIGVQPHIIEAVLNHVSGHKGGVAGIYNRSSYAKEKIEALTRWDEHVSALVRP